MTIARVAIIGAGTMGNGIAQACAGAGKDVVMVDVSDEALARGMRTIEASLDRLLKKEKITVSKKATVLSRIKTTTNYADIAKSDLVIEAATENLPVKLRIIKQIEDSITEDTIIATNTFYLVNMCKAGRGLKICRKSEPPPVGDCFARSTLETIRRWFIRFYLYTLPVKVFATIIVNGCVDYKFKDPLFQGFIPNFPDMSTKLRVVRTLIGGFFCVGSRGKCAVNQFISMSFSICFEKYLRAR